MMLLTSGLLLLWMALPDILAVPTQAPLEVPAIATPRKLHGRFLHITDMHPDLAYRAKTSESTSCHRKKGKKKKNTAGYYGLPHSECDSPLRLTNFTLDFLGEKWASDIDFVIWTGDNARHDNDRKLPRTPSEIYDLNRAVATKMASVFTSRGIPVVPSLGQRPNSITNEFASIWKAFIPFPHLQIFQRGAYFSVEVVPDAVAVISLNTMYFYDSNKAVGGCEFKDRGDAGNLQFDWLEVQLKGFRARDMQVRRIRSKHISSLNRLPPQVWISGHVPPSPGNYFPECYVRYVELALRFQDTILGHLYGFFFLEANDLELSDASQIASGDDLFDTLLADFAAIPKEKDINLDNYAVINVSPVRAAKSSSKRKHGHHRGDRKDKTKQCMLDMYHDTWRCQLNESHRRGSNQLWTPLGYAQYYIPHLEEATKGHAPSFKLEYVTYGRDALVKKRQTPYGLDDLTVGSWVGLARRVGGSLRVRGLLRRYMYMES
ncbi:hypothetical protein B0H10DRAFT_2165301 [Mycena sp. CBHHK59/15]|nr:hypothetical protein B0H10DRAFT_2165301 [Mycena sp. CBHHK59/15]